MLARGVCCTLNPMAYLHSAHVKNFQSIENVSIEFAPGLTTVVGQSSTGKSAILRALRTLAHNTSRPQVRAGTSALHVEVELEDGTRVGVERGKSKSTYTVGAEQYTKAGVTVPEPVEKILQLSGTDPDVHFSFQFDKPYLLAETGSTISSVLGRLTQAHVLREAVREGSRISQQHSTLAKTRRADIQMLAERLKTEFVDIPSRRQAVAKAIEATDQAEKIFSEAQRLEDVATRVEHAQAVVDQLQAVVPVDQRHALEEAETLLHRVEHLEQLAQGVESAQARVTQCQEAVEIRRQTQEVVHKRYAEALQTLKVCPTCGQDVA